MWQRKPVVAGSFYPGNAAELTREVDSYIAGAGAKTVKGNIMGIVSPHAGYIYSGPVAGYAFKELKGMPVEVAVVIAPSHRGRFAGASVIPEGVFETPLGGVTIDAALGSKLMEKERFDFIREAHAYEHSLEVQVPFLQRVLDNFTIVPIVVGTTDLEQCRAIGDGLADTLAGEKKKWVIVISTDLSHYYSYAQAKTMDAVFIESLKCFNDDEIKRVTQSGKAEACGEGPVLAGLDACKKCGAASVEILKYANSGDTAGDKNKVVGYVAAAIVK